MYSNPVLVALLAWAVRGEMLSLCGCLGIAVTLLGVVVVAQPPFLFGGHDWSPSRLAGRELFPDPLAQREPAADHPHCLWHGSAHR